MNYTLDEMTKDFTKALTNSRMGPFSHRYIGDPSKISLWNKDKFIELYNGLASAYILFYNDIGISFKDFAQVVMCECLQESTGNYNLWVSPIMLNDGDAHGIIQATPQSVILDYHVWGQPIIDVSGSVILNPKEISKWDLSHCTLNLIIWAWYTRNTLAVGMSLNEYGFPEWHRQPNNIVRDFGNALYIWLGGPENFRQDQTKIANNPGHLDYYKRVKDYYVCNMGTEEQFEKMFSTPIPKKLVAINPQFLNISIDKLNTIRTEQQQNHLKINRHLSLGNVLENRHKLYGIQHIGRFGFHVSKNKYNEYPFKMTEEQVEDYKKTIYPIWNKARLNGLARSFNPTQMTWTIDNQTYSLKNLS